MSFDLSDVLVVAGALLLGVAVFLFLGWPGLVGYVGIIALALGLALELRDTHEKSTL